MVKKTFTEIFDVSNAQFYEESKFLIDRTESVQSTWVRYRVQRTVPSTYFHVRYAVLGYYIYTHSGTSLSGESGTPPLQNIPRLEKFPA